MEPQAPSSKPKPTPTTTNLVPHLELRLTSAMPQHLRQLFLPLLLLPTLLNAQLLKNPSQLQPAPKPAETDWLISTPTRKSGLFQGTSPNTLSLNNGLIQRNFLLKPNAATIAIDQLATGESLLRSIRPEAEITLNGQTYPVGGLTGQPAHNYLLPEWLPTLTANTNAFQFVGFRTNAIQPRLQWKPRTQWISQTTAWPPPGLELTLVFQAPPHATDIQGVSVEIHHAIYDHLPLISKWFTLHNQSGHPITINTFKSEILACVEASSEVEDMLYPKLPNIHVETDFTTCSMTGSSAQRQTIQWLPDPSYTSQVNYRLQTPCLLECAPPLGPNLTIENQTSFNSLRTWILFHDSSDETRKSLALARMYRTITPWTTENPLIFHVRSAQPDDVRFAIDQAADVGFELVILTFGSGFNMENEDPDYLAQIRQLADYAHEHNIAFGGYSLLASRSINPENDVVNPETGQPGGFATFGNSPCLESSWGQDYFRKLYKFFESTGCDVLEHDGSYPGDACASTNHPGHSGYPDSRWKQWQTISSFYQWCRSQGIYLNVPDWYFTHGSSKTGMGYRETNWSLPRSQQEIIERQNILDGTRFKTPSMGWMFVPLTEYHGGGAAATIEPLAEHLDHYERRLANLLGAGVQACFRGPRLYDTDTTRAMVTRWVQFYKENRAILDSDLIPLRRADGRDWDGWLHVNPHLDTPAMAMVYNPLPHPIQPTIRIPLYYSGITQAAQVRVGSKDWTPTKLDSQSRASLQIQIDAHGHLPIWFKHTH